MGEKSGVEVPAGGAQRNPGDEDRPGARQTGEQVCPRCGGGGRVDAGPCPECGGSGRVVAIVGDA
ncbi:hypothetical protein [Azospirillum sp.]|uniref:hypothetical protein n=1 Tax=Azospirillum sp. TaxID=34012 RepID=UPI002D64F3AD|nr:hypothetical protein [Azospirillum sp.]HYD64989.1 hypothetical protein [Azospirillum sp.]